MANDSYNLLGQNGAEDASGTVTLARTARAIQAINGSAATLTVTDDNKTGTDLLTSIGAGQVVYGKFTAVAVTAGEVTCYY